MNRDVAKGTKGTLLALGTSLFSVGTIQHARKSVWAYLTSTVQWADSIGLHGVLEAAVTVARTYVGGKLEFEPTSFMRMAFPKIVKAFNRANRRRWVRTRKLDVANTLRLGLGADRVFFLVSSHQNPQEAHAPFQGKILVNSHWRLLGESYRARVGSYIRNRKVMSVQRAMREPYYLFVRPNCMHYLIPLDTEEVLSSSPSAVARRHRATERRVHRPYTDKQLYRQRRALYLLTLGLLERKLGRKGKQKKGLGFRS